MGQNDPRWYSTIYRAIAIASTAFILLTGIASAISDPDGVTIEQAKVYHSLYEEDDFLVIFMYDLEYASTPDEPANDAFIFRLMDGSDELGVVLPYPFYDKGYQEGIASFYFPALTAPTWDESYNISIEGNPLVFPAMTPVTYTLNIGDYSALDDQAGNQLLLGNHIISLVEDLEIAWDTTLITTTEFGDVLNDTGSAYIANAVPGIGAFAPQIFSVQTADPTYSERGWTKDYETELANRFNGTFIGDGLSGVASWLHISPRFLTGALMFVAFVAVAILVARREGKATPGFVIGIPVLLMGALLGWIPLTIVFVIVFMMVMLTGYIFFFRTA